MFFRFFPLFSTSPVFFFLFPFAIFRAFLAADSKLIANFATRTLKNMENGYAVLINDGMPQGKRLIKLNQIAIQQMQVLEDNSGRNLLK